MSRRFWDIAGAVAGLVVFAPVMAVITVAILLDDGRPVLFRQTRVGRQRRPFTLLKFRSMRGEQITRVGRVLRATGLDEIVQFINILCGDMSPVGPRPLTPDDVDRLGWSGPDTDFRWSVRPGLTGLAQLSRPATGPDSLALDRAYLERRSAWLDLRLIALSFAVNALGKRRVRRWVPRA